uniref:Uncharacterized protein n=1 Tax=Amphimedon queenslandica TaxID=400682 RepID=A0A1X7TI77_AMPQE
YKSGSIQTLMDCTTIIITSTVCNTVDLYSTVTVTPSTVNVIPIVIVTTATVMISLIVTGNRSTSNQNITVPLESCPAYDDISRINTANCEAYGKRDTFITAEYETVNVN